jgi:hypothetical protein
MGGSAFLIYGSVDDQLLQPRPAERSRLDRLLGRHPMVASQWKSFGRTRKMITLPSDGLDVLCSDFRHHVTTRFEQPWASTKAMIEYLAADVTTIYLRGDQYDGEEVRWYVQLTFSGCAGVAQVASELCTHWAEKWYQEERDRITAQVLRPHGFEPEGATEGGDSTFAPIGRGGYAIYTATPNEQDEMPAEGYLSRYFDVDEWALEQLDDVNRTAAMRTLDNELRPLIPVGRCCCQWCAPTLDAAQFDRVAPFGNIVGPR